MAITFEGYERRIDKINKTCAEYGIADLEEARKICTDLGFDPYQITEGIQSIAFENAKWAYVLGCAIAVKKGVKTASEAAAAIGIGLQAFCVPGSVAEERKVGLGHGNLGAMLLGEDTECFAFLAGHESFAAAEGAIGIANNANKARKKPLRVILNGLGKDAAQIIARINGFTYVQTKFDYYTSELEIVREVPYSDGPRAAVKCYGADDVREGVAIMWHENATAPTTSARALPSCGTRTSTSRSPATPPTPRASSTPSLAPTSRSASWPARSTSPSPLVAAPAVRCTRTTWPQALPPTA